MADFTTVREYIEWSQFYWFDTAGGLPRVLLIGDSIVVGHAELLWQRVKGRFGVDFWATAMCVSDVDYRRELDYVLGRMPAETVIFNNSLHGWEVDDDLYLAHLDATMEYLAGRAPRLAWRAGTPIKEQGALDRFEAARTPRLEYRNAGAAKIAARLGVPVLDWYDRLAAEPAYFAPDAIHYSDAGRNVQAGWLADFVQSP